MQLNDKLTEHFTYREMIRSDVGDPKGIDNTPPDWALVRFGQLCDLILEPVRNEFGAIEITSGYRCPKLNSLVSSVPSSEHTLGQAADIKPVSPKVKLDTIFRWIVAMNLRYNQIIYEFDRWIHVSHDPIGQRSKGPYYAVNTSKGVGYVRLTPDQVKVGEHLKSK